MNNNTAIPSIEFYAATTYDTLICVLRAVENNMTAIYDFYLEDGTVIQGCFSNYAEGTEELVIQRWDGAGHNGTFVTVPIDSVVRIVYP